MKIVSVGAINDRHMITQECTAVDADAECLNVAAYHFLMALGAPGVEEEGSTVALCFEHGAVLLDEPSWWVEMHPFEAQDGPCGLPGTVWADDHCELDPDALVRLGMAAEALAEPVSFWDRVKIPAGPDRFA